MVEKLEFVYLQYNYVIIPLYTCCCHILCLLCFVTVVNTRWMLYNAWDCTDDKKWYIYWEKIRLLAMPGLEKCEIINIIFLKSKEEKLWDCQSRALSISHAILVHFCLWSHFWEKCCIYINETWARPDENVLKLLKPYEYLHVNFSIVIIKIVKWKVQNMCKIGLLIFGNDFQYVGNC